MALGKYRVDGGHMVPAIPWQHRAAHGRGQAYGDP